ncbi:MAG: hypothetical protein ACRECO_19960 [Xanthobacteraceae bacterium]
MLRTVITATFAATIVLSSALAQKPQTQLVKGKIDGVESSAVIVAQAKGGGKVKVNLTLKAVIMTVGKATLADIRPGSFIGVGAMPQADGSQKAIRVMIFPEIQRGTGEGHRPWNKPGTTMTNATVDTQVKSVDGQVLTVKYKGGTQKIIIGPDALILANIPGSKTDLKVGAAITIPAAKKSADGMLETARVNIGRGDYIP